MRRTQSRYGKRLVGLLFIFLVWMGLWYANEVWMERPRLALHGVPINEQPWWTQWDHVLRNDDFILNYSEIRRNALWVMYRLSVNQQYDRNKRPRFETDKRTLARVSYGDYRHSGYSRGHLAPNYAVATHLGAQAQRDAFLMSNISPQKAKLNQKVWQRLEAAVVDHFLPKFDALWVITGPVFATEPKHLKGNWIDIPTAFYKICIGQTRNPKGQETLNAIGFIVPQTVQGHEPLTAFLTSIDEIERQTQLNFLPQLADGVQQPLEQDIDDALFDVKSVANLPNRY